VHPAGTTKITFFPKAFRANLKAKTSAQPGHAAVPGSMNSSFESNLSDNSNHSTLMVS